MSLKAMNKNPKSINREQPEGGTHMARLVGLTDLGHQPGFTWGGKDIESSWKVEFTYELVAAKMSDGRPFWVSEEVALNDYEGDGITSTMMARVRTLDKGNESKDGTELVALLDKPCMVTVSINDKGYPKLKGQASVSGIPLGMTLPELYNPVFSFDMDDPDMDTYHKFSDFTQGKLQKAINFNDTELAKQLAQGEEF